MADTATDFPRDRRGEWVPGDLPRPSPVFSRPWRIKPVLDSLFGLDGLLGWQSMIYIGLCVVAWLFFTPEMARMRSFSFGWIAEIYLRNAALLLLVVGPMHLPPVRGQVAGRPLQVQFPLPAFRRSQVPVRESDLGQRVL